MTMSFNEPLELCRFELCRKSTKEQANASINAIEDDDDDADGSVASHRVASLNQKPREAVRATR